MAQAKTKTSKKLTPVTNNVVTEKKGGETVTPVNTITVKEALQALQMSYNDYQSYRQKNNKTYRLATKVDMIAFAKRLNKEELVKLAKVFIYVRYYEARLGNYLYNIKKTESQLDKAYGKEQTNIMELTTEEIELINKRRAKAQEFKEAKAQDAKVKTTKKTKGTK